MRQIILDVETTGLEPEKGHRIIEIGCVELKDRRKTNRIFHHFLNPEREIEDGAYDVHGISREDLQGKPVFKDIAREFIEFIRDSEIIIHNAPFDAGFIDMELSRLGKQWGALGDYCQITDTLLMARELHPGQRNSLDALCLRYQVDNSRRDLHGALLDAQILLDVYLAMTGGQESLLLDEEVDRRPQSGDSQPRFARKKTRLKVIEPTEDELAAHHKMLALIEREKETA